MAGPPRAGSMPQPCQRKCYGLLHLSTPAAASSAAASTTVAQHAAEPPTTADKPAPVPTCYGISVPDSDTSLAFQEHNLLRELPHDSTVASFLCVGKATYFSSYEKHPTAAKLGMTADREYPPVCEGVEFLHYVMTSSASAASASAGIAHPEGAVAAGASLSRAAGAHTRSGISAPSVLPASAIPAAHVAADNAAAPTASPTIHLTAAQAVAAASSFAAPSVAVMVASDVTASSHATSLTGNLPAAASEAQGVDRSMVTASAPAGPTNTTGASEPTTGRLDDERITTGGAPLTGQRADQQLEPGPFSVSGQYPSWLLPKPGPVTTALQRAGSRAADFAAARKEDAEWFKERALQAAAEADPLWLARGFGEHAGSTWTGMVGLWGSLEASAGELRQFWRQRSGK